MMRQIMKFLLCYSFFDCSELVPILVHLQEKCSVNFFFRKIFFIVPNVFVCYQRNDEKELIMYYILFLNQNYFLEYSHLKSTFLYMFSGYLALCSRKVYFNPGRYVSN